MVGSCNFFHSFASYTNINIEYYYFNMNCGLSFITRANDLETEMLTMMINHKNIVCFPFVFAIHQIISKLSLPPPLFHTNTHTHTGSHLVENKKNIDTNVCVNVCMWKDREEKKATETFIKWIWSTYKYENPTNRSFSPTPSLSFTPTCTTAQWSWVKKVLFPLRVFICTQN